MTARSLLTAIPVSMTLALVVGAALAAEGPIQDNSFLIEEAYNQERGVVQHISTFTRATGTGEWVYTFSQEWPLPDESHQLSFTIPVEQLRAAEGAHAGLGDLALNYRRQLLGNGEARVAFAPRVTMLLPTGRWRYGLGAGSAAAQVNLPVSWTWGRHVVTHWNAGLTHVFDARDEDGRRASTNAYVLGQSVVWLLRPRFNLLVETCWTRTGSVAGAGSTAYADALTVSPGLRWAWDFPSGLEIVPGVAVPVGVGPGHGERALFLYLSFEHPFRKTPAP